MNPWDSPCIQVCTMDPDTGLCSGCARTLDEIAAWSGLSESERAAINARLPGRKAGTGASAPSVCSGCGTSFSCGAKDPTKACWCVAYPPIAPNAAMTGCFCPACLAAASQNGP